MGWLQDRLGAVSNAIGTGGADTNIWDKAGNAVNTSVGGDSSLGKAFTQVAQETEKTVKDLPKIAEAVTKNTLAQAKAFVKNPIPTLATIALTTVGVPYPYASAIVDVANGGSWEKAVIQMGMTYYAGTGDSTVPKTTLQKVLTSASTSAVSAKLLGATDQEVINAALGGAINTYVSDLLYKPVDKGGYGLNPSDIGSKLLTNTTAAVTNAVLRGKPIGDAIVQSAMITAGSHYVKQGFDNVTRNSETLKTAQKYVDEAKAKVKSLWTPSLQAKKEKKEEAERVLQRTHDPAEKAKAQTAYQGAKNDYDSEAFEYNTALRDYDRKYQEADRAERDLNYHKTRYVQDDEILDLRIRSSQRDDDAYGFTEDEIRQITGDEIDLKETDALANKLAEERGYKDGQFNFPPSVLDSPEQLQQKLEQEQRDIVNEKKYNDYVEYLKQANEQRIKENDALAKAGQAYTQTPTTTPTTTPTATPTTPPTTPPATPNKTPQQLAQEAEATRIAEYNAKIKADADAAAQAKAAEEKRIADERAAVEAAKQKEYQEAMAADQRARDEYVREKAERQAKEEAAANALAEANAKAKQEADAKAAQDKLIADAKAAEDARAAEIERQRLAEKAIKDKADFDAHLKQQGEAARLAEEAEAKVRRQQELDNAEGARLAAERVAKAEADAKAKAEADARAKAENDALAKAGSAYPPTPKTPPPVPAPAQTDIGASITNAATATAAAAIAKQFADEQREKAIAEQKAKADAARAQALAQQEEARAKAKAEYEERIRLQEEARAKAKAEYEAKVKAENEAKKAAYEKALAAYNEKIRLQNEAKATATGTTVPTGTTTPTGTLKPVTTAPTGAPTGTLKPVVTAPTGTLTPINKPTGTTAPATNPTGTLTPVTKPATPTGTLTPVTKPAAPTGGLTPVTKPVTAPVTPTGGLTAVKPTTAPVTKPVTPAPNLPTSPTSTTIAKPTGTLTPAPKPTGTLTPVTKPTGTLKPVAKPTGTLKPV